MNLLHDHQSCYLFVIYLLEVSMWSNIARHTGSCRTKCAVYVLKYWTHCSGGVGGGGGGSSGGVGCCVCVPLNLRLNKLKNLVRSDETHLL